MDTKNKLLIGHAMPIIFLGIIWILGGCGAVGKNFNASDIENIINGTTTQAEIRIMFGEPFKTGIQNSRPVWVYEYNHYHLINDNASKDLIVVFDPNGIVQSHQYMTSEPTP